MDYYNVFNWVLIGFIIVSCFFLYSDYEYKRSTYTSEVLIVIFCLFNVIYWGGRPSSVGIDTGIYVNRLRIAQGFSSIKDYIDFIDGDYFFGVVIYYLSRLGDLSLYFTGIALFTMFGFYVFFIKLAKHNSHAILALLMVASMFSFSAMISNIIRNGLAIALFLPCTYYTFSKKYKWALLWGVASFLSHQSILLPLLGLLLVHLIRSPLKYFVFGYITSSILAFNDIGLHSFSFINVLNIEKLNLYINSEIDVYRTGFRPDFYLFNTFFLISFLILNKNKNVAFDRYLKLYIVLSSVFFLCFHIPFSDRFGIYSWIFIPVVLFLGTQSYNIKYRFTISTMATFILYFINQMIYTFINVPTPEI